MRWASSSRKTAALLAAFFVLGLEACAWGLERKPQILPLDPEPLVISTAAGAKSYLIEIADNDAERAIGLMHRKSLGPRQGMLFDFGVTRIVNMWMKDTDVPLDMIFIKQDGSIESIRENTAPQSLDLVSSRDEVRFALELAAGSAKQDGLHIGDVASHRIILAATQKNDGQ